MLHTMQIRICHDYKCSLTCLDRFDANNKGQSRIHLGAVSSPRSIYGHSLACRWCLEVCHFSSLTYPNLVQRKTLSRCCLRTLLSKRLLAPRPYTFAVSRKGAAISEEFYSSYLCITVIIVSNSLLRLLQRPFKNLNAFLFVSCSIELAHSHTSKPFERWVRRRAKNIMKEWTGTSWSIRLDSRNKEAGIDGIALFWKVYA